MNQDLKEKLRQAQELADTVKQDTKEKLRQAQEFADAVKQDTLEKLETMKQNAFQNRRDTAEKLLMAQKSSDLEDPWDAFFTERIGMTLSKGFIRLHIKPNTITILSGLIGMTGGFLFYPRDIRINLLGIALEIFAAILDACDGQVARLTHQTSEIGRFLDGICDGLCFASVYLSLGLRLMGERVPFTRDLRWGFFIWPLVLLCGLYSHMSQCRMADYYRNLHLFFLKGEDHSELSRSEKLRGDLAALPADTAFWKKMYLRNYITYTKAQEKVTPKMQRLLEAMEAAPGNVPDELRLDYVTESRRFVQITNLLTYNLRAYTLYFLLLFRMHIVFFPFVILVMGAMKMYMVHRYEGIADGLYAVYFAEKEEKE